MQQKALLCLFAAISVRTSVPSVSSVVQTFGSDDGAPCAAGTGSSGR